MLTKMTAAHTPARIASMPPIIRTLMMGQLTFFGAYSIMSGPGRKKMERYFTVTPDSGLQALTTFHLCHTDPVPLAFNMAALGTLGAYHVKKAGAHSFLRLFGLGCAAATLAVAIDARSNPNQTQNGHLGASAALLAHTCFKYPQFFALYKMTPMFICAAALGYGIYYDDKAIVAGLTAGYAAILMAL